MPTPKPPPPVPVPRKPPPRYAVLVETDMDDFQTKANKLIGAGMIPQGGLIVAIVGGTPRFGQAFYRDLGPPPPGITSPTQ